MFSSSGGVKTDLTAGPPPTIEPFSDLEEWDLDGDFDGPPEGNPTEIQPQVSPDTLEESKRPIKAYLVRDVAYRTLVGNCPEVCCVTNRLVQFARDHMVYLFRGNIFLQQLSRGSQRLCEVRLPVCR